MSRGDGGDFETHQTGTGGTNYMFLYGYLRPWGISSEIADIYGNQEGIWYKHQTNSITNIQLLYTIKTQLDVNPDYQVYKISLGIGNASDNFDTFSVLASQEINSQIVDWSLNILNYIS